MIKLIDHSGVAHPLTGYSKHLVVHKLDGCNTMSFYVDTAHEQYKIIEEESVVIACGNEWLIKKIDDDKIDCSLNFDFLKKKVYKNYRSETRTLAEVLVSHLPEGWIVKGANITDIRRTIEFDYCTDYDVIYAGMNTYKVYYVWHILDKELEIFSQENLPSTGEYLTSELNLRSLSFKGNTTNFATRLYAYGANGISVADAMVDDGNGETKKYGLEYVENNSFCDKVVCGYWSDSRFKVPENLLEEAKKKVIELSTPVRSYECDVVDLAKRNEKYSFLKLQMHSTVTLIDVERGIKVDHRIVEYKEHPDNDDLNTVVLSCVPDTISFRIRSESEKVKEEIEKNNNSFNESIAMASAMLTSAFGGYVIGSGSEIFIMDNPNPELAEVVWRWGINGIGKSTTGISGPYTTSLTIDDHFITNIIDAMVIRGAYIEGGSITAESISQSYTDGVLSESYKAAKGYVEYAAERISEFLSNPNGDGKLDILNEEITKIQQTIEGLTLKFTSAISGGINLVTNSSGLNGLSDDWEYEGVVVVLQNEDFVRNTVSDSGFRLSENASLKQVVKELIVGNSYTVSCKVKKTSLIAASVVVLVGNKEYPLIVTSDEVAWKEFSVTIENIEQDTLEIIATTKEDYLFLADVMVCEGLVPQSWTPAPNEIYTDEVKIDKHGIKVSNGETSQETVMNKEEFAGYYREEKVFSLNKDETFNKKTIVKEELKVGACMFLPYENGSEIGLNIVIED